MKMKVLVFGARGFLGHRVATHLQSQGFAVVRSGRNTETNVRGCDLTEPGCVLELLDIVAPDSIVNCAARADFGEHCLAKLYPVNTLFPGILANWCANHQAHLVQASGSLVYGVSKSAISIQDPLNPDTDYGVSKWLADEMILASGCAATILRFCGLIGAEGPTHLGFNRTITEAANGRIPTISGKGRALRNYLHVGDAAIMIEYALRQHLEGVHLAAGSQVASIAEMLSLLCEIYLPGKVPLYKPGAEAQDQVITSSTKLPPSRPLRDALVADLP